MARAVVGTECRQAGKGKGKGFRSGGYRPFLSPVSRERHGTEEKANQETITKEATARAGKFV
jgi:hypothetical protein